MTEQIRPAAEPQPSHRDWTVVASDGQVVRGRTTEMPGVAPQAIIVMQDGTLSQARYFDLMADALAPVGIVSYSVPARHAGARSYRQHATDLDQVVQRARQEHPHTPLVVMGVSFGAAVALEWRRRFGHPDVPVVAMSPVIASRFSYLGPRDFATVLLGMVSRRAAQRQVASPLSAGVPLTTNPQSEEWHVEDPRATVPASLFDDNLRMVIDVTLHRGANRAPLLIILAGDDAVAYNSISRGWSRVLRSSDKTVVTVPRAAHDLSQETNHRDLTGRIQRWVLEQAQQVRDPSAPGIGGGGGVDR